MSRPAVLVSRVVFPEVVARLREHFVVEANDTDAVWSQPELIERLRR